MTMAEVEGFPYFEVEFDKQGRPVDPGERQAVLTFLGPGGGGVATTDLLVLSHGWNNDIAEARDLYRRLLGRLRAQLDAGSVPAVAGRRLAVVGVFWPSKKFADKELIPGGAASAGGGGVGSTDLAEQIESLRGVFDVPDADQRLDQAKVLIPLLDDNPQARDLFVDLVRGLEPAPTAEDDRDLPSQLHSLSGDEVLTRLGTPPPLPVPEPGGAAGGAADLGTGGPDTAGAIDVGTAQGLRSFFGGVKAGARNLLNLFTYYKMKNRAGEVGSGGVHDLLRAIRAARPDLALHLAGHSFGGRLVTAAAAGPAGGPPGGEPLVISTMSLLQAAFSHYGFAQDFDGDSHDGFFRGVVTGNRVSGPVLISHSKKDTAVGLAYPIASRLARQVASALGDENDVFGGLGRNGAQKTPERVVGDLLPVGGGYSFAGGKLYNLKADTIILSHSDIAKDEVAYAMLTAIAAS
jgi:hypothetical protein